MGGRLIRPYVVTAPASQKKGLRKPEAFFLTKINWGLLGPEGLKPSTVSHAFGDICRKSVVAGIRFHDLRHTHATMLMKQGTNPKVLQERLRHYNRSMTLDVYSHVIPGMQESAVLHFEKSISGFSESQSV